MPASLCSVRLLTVVLLSWPVLARAGSLTCELASYRPRPGLQAVLEPDGLVVSWEGDGGAPLRMRLAIQDGVPVVGELAARGVRGSWNVLARNLRPEFAVTSGVRRVSEQQLEPLRQLGRTLTPELLEREKWYAFWDAPLLVPGVEKGRPPRNPGLPRRPEEIRRATATYRAAGCEVKTDGGRLEVTFSGLSMGIFSGSVRYTVYQGTSLVRLEAVARTEEPSVAYIYRAGLKGFSTAEMPRAVWRDTANQPQEYRFGGATNQDPVPLAAANRLVIAEGPAGAVAVFPPPHTFFFAREVETNLGYVWYRKDSDASFSMGVRQAEGEQVDHYRENFALYNAPPGTWQRMAMYLYLTPRSGEAARE